MSLGYRIKSDFFVRILFFSLYVFVLQKRLKKNNKKNIWKKMKGAVRMIMKNMMIKILIIELDIPATDFS